MSDNETVIVALIPLSISFDMVSVNSTTGAPSLSFMVYVYSSLVPNIEFVGLESVMITVSLSSSIRSSLI
ncbi:hypothetical protein ES705_45876 [subsurface metagenome]